MRTSFSVAVRCLLLVGLPATVPARLAAAEPAPVSHPFLCCDLGKGAVIRVDANGAAVWEYRIAAAHDVWALPNGRVLAASPSAGIVEVAPDKKVTWQYRPADGTLYTCQPLGGERVLTAVKTKGGGIRIREIARDGNTASQIAAHKDTDIRLCRKTEEGTYLLAARGARQVWEYDKDGKLLRAMDAPGNPFLAVRTARGTTLIACGDGHGLVEVDKNNKIVWRLNENDLAGHPLRFVAGVQELANGNIVLCNWLGHGKFSGEAQILEVNREKKVVWKVNNWQALALPCHVQLLDQDPNAPARR